MGGAGVSESGKCHRGAESVIKIDVSNESGVRGPKGSDEKVCAGARGGLREKARVCWCARRLEGEGSRVLVRVAA